MVKYSKKLLIKCIHCGEVVVDWDKDPNTFKAFVSNSYLDPKTCPKCNEEAKLIGFIPDFD